MWLARRMVEGSAYECKASKLEYADVSEWQYRQLACCMSPGMQLLQQPLFQGYGLLLASLLCSALRICSLLPTLSPRPLLLPPVRLQGRAAA